MQCPICKQQTSHLIKHFHSELDAPIIEDLKSGCDWQPEQGVCTRCIDEVHSSLQMKTAQLDQKDYETLAGYSVLPISKRLNTSSKYTGKGVTICMIDSGFYLHPDITTEQNRILALQDITNPDQELEYFKQPHPTSWHGTMTTVACAGNGFLSEGKYAGLAKDANLVLLKVAEESGKISTESIAKALEWAIDHHEEYNIRIINMSVTDDDPAKHEDSIVSQLVEKAVDSGIVVVAAAGNSTQSSLKPPASSPKAITVGGLNDQNTLNPLQYILYHSTYGTTLDGLLKPDLIAPAIWVAAPILPQTTDHKEAQILFELLQTPTTQLQDQLKSKIHHTKLPDWLTGQPVDIIQHEIQNRIQHAKYLSPDYMHVDGTSFAAPIVCSVIAQLLEAKPQLDPGTIREILLRTARHIPGVDNSRQGYGVIQPASAIYEALEEIHYDINPFAPILDQKKQEIIFHFHDHDAGKVFLAGNFNDWRSDQYPLQEASDGQWEARFGLPPKGWYTYKYVIDHDQWKADPRNVYRVSDGYNGFNSVILVEN